MKLTYLGTAAAEGFPAVFCNCEYCREARLLGGKNLRSRSQSLLNDDMLIDFPPDTMHHLLMHGIEGHKIKHLLITHGHNDHLYPGDLIRRRRPYCHDMQAARLEILCSQGTADLINAKDSLIDIRIIKAFETVELGDYSVTALPARHMPGGEPLIYVIRSDKTILYAHDTGYFLEEVFDYIRGAKLYFDMVSIDCTNVDIPIGDEGNHMGFPNDARLLKRLADMGAIDGKTIKYVNHFSHNGNPLQENLEKKAAEIGCSVAYDGCSVCI